MSEQQSLLRDSAIKLAAAHAGPKRARKLRDAAVAIDREAWSAVVDAGWVAALVAEQHGGLGLAALDLAIVLEETGKQLLMLPLIEAAAANWAISQATATRPPPALLQGALAGTKLIVPAIAPPGWGGAATVPAMRLRATSGGAVLDGSVDHVPAADAADGFLVAATDADNSAVLCLVPSTAFAITTRRNVDGSTSSKLTASNAPIAADTVLAGGGAAFELSARLQQLLVLLASAELLGVAQAALDITNDYLKLRKQFGKPIGSFQGLQHRMVDCFVDLELSRSLLYRVLATWGDGGGHPAMVSACKARLSRGALVTVRTALQLHGAIGYTDEHDIGLFYKRAVALAAKYGNEIMHVDAFSASTLSSVGQ